MAISHPEHRVRTVPIYVRLLLAIISLVTFLLISELALNLLDAKPAFKNQFFPLNRDIDFADVYEKDDHLFWRFRKNRTIDSRAFSRIAYRINSDGRRGPETRGEKPPFRILSIGNSCTFGWGVPWEETWTARLETKMKQQFGHDVEVINAGVPGYTSHQGKIYFEEELVDLDPDIVLICFGWNDHWAAGMGIPDSDQQAPAPWLLKVHNVLAPLKTYQFLRMVLLSATEKKQDLSLGTISTQRVSQDQFYMNLRSMVRLARSKDIEPVLVIPPIAALAAYFEETSSPFHQIHAAYQKAMIRLANREHVGIVDLQQVFDGYDNLYDDAYGDAVHYNSLGHKVAAEAIVETIRPIYTHR